MKVIIKSFEGNSYNLILSEEQVKFATWLVNNDILYDINIIDNMKWENIK